MDRQNDFPLRGIFRNEIVFVRDYRQRAYWFGVFQLVISVCYLLAAFLFNKLMLIMSLAMNIGLKNVTEYENETSNYLEITAQNSELDSIFSELYFWMTINIIKAVLHVLSSFLIIWATSESIATLRAITLCNMARLMNLGFIVYEIVVLLLMYQEWQFALFFVLYRFWLNHELRGLLKQVQLLSPPPPGHVHHE